MRENDLLQHVTATNAALPEHVTLPPGDDMGAIRLLDPTALVTVDQVADGIHFDLDRTPLPLIARKAITRNLSDVAAMAAQPAAAVVAVSFPKSFGQDNATTLLDAMRETAESFACPIVGGDIAMWDGKLLISVTILAQPWPDVEPVRRTGSQIGDAIYVTGELGHTLDTGHHLTFTPRLEVARLLATDPTTRPHAMMDLSDGLAQDLPRLVDHAELVARVMPTRTPAVPDDTPAWQHALNDGEDYELLFTASPDAPIPAEVNELVITRVGTVTDSGGLQVLTMDGTRLPMHEVATGWEHRG